MAGRQPKALDFEKALGELEGLVEQMEKGDLTLEDSLRRFERGIELYRLCRGTLEQAEQKVEQLLEKNGRIQATPLDTQD